MTRVALAARMARRELRTHPWRTLLAVLIMALPVMAVQTIMLSAFAHDASQRVADSLATDGADFAVGIDPRNPNGGGEHDPIMAKLPKPVRTLETFDFSDWLVTRPGDALTQVKAIGNVPDSPRVRLVDGRLPRSVGETALNAPAMRAAHVKVGDKVELARANVKLRVVGEVTVRDQTKASAMVVGRAGSASAKWLDALIAKPLSTPRMQAGGSRQLLVWFAPHSNWRDALQRAQDQFWHDDGFVVNTASRNAPIAVVTGGAVAILAVIASVAFTIGSRRRLRALGLLASNGAAPGDIRLTVLVEGVLCGLIAAIGGTAVVYTGWATVGRTGWANNLIYSNLADPPHPFALLPVVAVALLCVIVGTLAAFWPARTAARSSVLSALAGRRPLPKLRARLPLLGLVTFGVGTAVSAYGSARGSRGDELPDGVLALAGLAVVLGGVLVAPAAVVAIGKLGAKLRGTGRLAARGIARDRTRYAAVIGAVAVGVAASAMLVVNQAQRSHQRSLDAPSYGLVTIQASSQVRGAAVAKAKAIIGDAADQVTSVVMPGVDANKAFAAAGSMVVLDPQAAAKWAPGTGIAEALRSGHLVSLHRLVNDPGEIGPTVGANVTPIPGFFRGGKVPPTTTVDLTPIQFTQHPVLERLMMSSAENPMLATPDMIAPGQENLWLQQAYLLRKQPISGAESAALDAIGSQEPTLALVRDAASQGTKDQGTVQDAGDIMGWNAAAYSNYQGPDHQATLLIVAIGASGVFTLLIVLVALALAASDGRDDEALFAAVGAPPALLRRRRTIEAAMLSFAGSLLGVLIGAIPTVASLHARTPSATHLAGQGLPAGYYAVPIPITALALILGSVTVLVTVVVWCGLVAKGLGTGVHRTRRPLVLTLADA